MRNFKGNHYKRRLMGELLESRCLLSTVGFITREIVPASDASGASSVHAADVDGDGDVDVLSASPDDNKITWYENTDGKGTFGTQQVITSEANFARSVLATDVDGDVDVLSAFWFKIAWYENTDGKGTFGSQQVITTEARSANTVFAADVDGDGDVDALSASSDGKIAWYENRLGGDVNDDGNVAFADFLALSANFGSIDAVWEDGDFDSNGKVEFADFLILSANFGHKRPTTEALPPENADMGTNLSFMESGG